MKKTPFALAIISLVFFCCTNDNKNFITGDRKLTVIKDVNLFDGERYREHVNIFFQDGLISEIDSGDIKTTKASLVLQGTGKTIIPPLLNAHVHLWQEENLKEALRSGVFGLFDMHNTDEAAGYLRKFRDSTGYSYFYSSGPGATVPGGHGTEYGIKVPTIDSSTSPRQFVEDRIKNNCDYIKILREPLMKTITFEQTREVIATAHEHSKLCFAHISRLGDAMKLAGQGIDGFEHIWNDEKINDAQLDSLKRNGVFIVPTLLVIKKWTESMGYYKISFLKFDEVLKELNKAYAAGIPILAGTDAPNFSLNYGDALFDELKLLSEAGLTNIDVLKAATTNVSRLYKVKEFGVVAVHSPASFILIDGNPVTNINDISKIDKIWQNGHVIR